jgi:hypothetical protein
LTATILTLTFASVTTQELRSQPVGTAFTYQGQLLVSLAPPNTPHDFVFRLYTNASTATVLAGPITNQNVIVSNGLFTTKIDFGPGAFNGDKRFLEIAVRPAGPGSFTTLATRQELSPTPYAIYAVNSGTASNAATAISVLANGVNAAAIQSGVITAGKIASAQVVKSLNGLMDAVTLSAGTNVSLTTVGNNIQINAAITSTVTCARRKFYMTSSFPQGNAALTACVAGYHMASLQEILDPSNLEYAHELGNIAHSLPDSGSGPPFSTLAFVRTGVSDPSTGNTVAGNANCNVWTSNSTNEFGTVIALKPTWTDAPSNVSPWDAITKECDNLSDATPPAGTTGARVHVWCVQD